MDKRRQKKAIVLLILATAGMLLPAQLSAQDLFGRRGDSSGAQVLSTSSNGLMDRGSGSASGDITGQGFGATNGDITGQGFGATNGNITGQTFGDNAPLGSGLFVLLAAGAGYATMKSRKKQSKQNRKEK